MARRGQASGVNVRVVNDSQTFFGTSFSVPLEEEIEELAANNILFDDGRRKHRRQQ
jgi:hypothetical protein